MSTSNEVYAVIGGSGFLGQNIVKTLSTRYPTSTIYSLDLFPPPSTAPLPPNATHVKLDLSASFDDLKLSPHPTSLFHTASPHLASGKEVCEKVNVQGTERTLSWCKSTGVKKFVYTSSSGVVFGNEALDSGVGLRNVDERLPYPEAWPDDYNRTKALAEQLVIAANGKDGLLTCAIRPSGIFGPGDRQVSYRILQALHNGQTNFQIGSNNNLQDFTFVDNLVHAHLLAMEKLETVITDRSVFDYRLPDLDTALGRRALPNSLTLEGHPSSNSSESPKSTTNLDFSIINHELSSQTLPHPPSYTLTSSSTSVDPPLLSSRNRFDQFHPSSLDLSYDPSSPIPIAGQVYFITNGEPIYFWDFARSLWKAYNGYTPTKVTAVPGFFSWFIGAGGELASWLKGQPAPLTRATATYMTIDRYFNIEKARIFLGYEPLVSMEEAVKITMDWHRKREELEAAEATKSKSG